MKFLILMILLIFPNTSSADSPALFSPGDTPLVSISNAKIPQTNVLTGGQPSREQIKEAKTKGIQRIINLRTKTENPSAQEEAAWVQEEGLEYISIPVDGHAGLTKKNAVLLFKELKRSAGQPTIVHCASGNRVGALMALGAFYFDHQSIEASVEFGMKAGMTSLTDDVRSILESEAKK